MKCYPSFALLATAATNFRPKCNVKTLLQNLTKLGALGCNRPSHEHFQNFTRPWNSGRTCQQRGCSHLMFFLFWMSSHSKIPIFLPPLNANVICENRNPGGVEFRALFHKISLYYEPQKINNFYDINLFYGTSTKF